MAIDWSKYGVDKKEEKPKEQAKAKSSAGIDWSKYDGSVEKAASDAKVAKLTTEYNSTKKNKNEFNQPSTQFATDNLAQSPTIKRIDALPSAKPKLSFVEQAKKNGSDYLDSVKKVTAPVVGVAGKGLAAVGKAYDKVSHLPVINQATGAMQGLIEPLVHSDAPAKDEPLWKKYLGNVADTYNVAQNIINPATLITGNLIPSKSDKSVIEKGKALLQAPKSAIQGAFNPDEARKRMEESLQSRSLVDKLVIGSASDPLSYVPLPSVRGIKTASSAVGDAFERFAARNKEAPIDFEQYLQASKNRNEISLGQIDRGEQGIVDKFNFMENQMGKNAPLQLTEPHSAVAARSKALKQTQMQAELERRSVLPTGKKPIQVPGETVIPQLNASPEYNLIQRIKEQQTLNLPEARPSTIAEINRRNGNVLPTNTNPIYGQGSVADPLGLPQGNYIKPTKLKVSGVNETLDHVITKIRPEVIKMIEAPARRDLLVNYVQKNTGFPLQEIRNMPIKDLQDYGKMIQEKLQGNLEQIAYEVAAKHGYDLPSLFKGEAPSVSGKIAKDAQSRVYGVPAPEVNITRPKFNKEVTGQAAAPKQGLSFNREPKEPESNPFVETAAQKAQRIAKQIKDAADRKRISELSRPIVGNNTALLETKISRPPLKGSSATPKAKPRATIEAFVNGNKEVAATTVKPKVAPIARVEPVVVNPPTVKPKTEIKPIVRTPGIRANYRNQLKNGNLSPELQAKIKATDQSYEILTNKASDDIAKESVKNLSKAESDFLLNQSGGADHIATGYRLQEKLDAMGLTERALIVSHKLAKDLTKGGQTSQAARIISRLSPEGQLLNLTRTAIKNDKTVSVADGAEFTKQAKIYKNKAGAGVRANQFTEILDRAAKGEQLNTDDIKKMSDYLVSAEKTIKPPKVVKVVDDLPTELKEPRKRDKIISYLDDAEQKALARIAARKNNLNSLPIGEWADHAIVVSAQIAKGTIKAGTHVEDLVKMFGEEIRPVATQVFQKAQSLIKRVSPTVGEGNLTKANEAFRRLSGAAEKEKAAVQEMALHVKKIIADSKSGKQDAADIQKLRDYSDEIAEMTADAKVRELPTQDQRFLQSVKSLSKKIAQVETEKIPMDQANKEISNILRQITKISEEGTEQALKTKVDNTYLSNIAHDVMNKTRPTPKPTTLQEKIVEKYLKQQDKDGVVVSAKDINTLRDLAKNITRLSGDSRIDADIAMQKILNSYEKSGAWDKVTAIRYMAMLLNTGTQLVNAASGPLMATTGHVADVFGTMVDIAMHTTLKTPRTTTLYGTNPIKFIARYFKNLKVGGAAGFHGVNPAGIQSTNEIRGLAYKGAYNPLSWGERTLGAVAKGADYATYKSVYDSEIVKQGFLDAINTGVKRSDKAAIKAHVEKFVNEPTENAMLMADRIGKNTTFQRSDSLGGQTANALNSFKGKVGVYVKPVVNVVVPFVRTPINIASTAVTLTPAGVLKGLFQLTSMSKATQREAIRSLSLGLTGSAGIGTIGYYLSQLGIITGSNDSGDKDVDAIREQAGLGKYRFNQSALKRYLSALLDGEGSEAAEKAAKYKEGDHAFDYNKFQPLAFPMAIGASLGKSQGKPLLGRLETAGGDAYGSLFGMSTLKSVQSIFQPTYGGTQGEKALGPLKRVEEAFLKSFSWGGLAQEARRQDPIVRKTPFNDGVIANTKAYFQSRIPFGVSESLPASKTTLGMDKMNAPGVMGQYVNPYKSEVAAYSQAAVIISELIDRTGDFSVAPSAPEKTVEVRNKAGEKVKINIPPDRYEQLQEEVGHNIIIKIMALNPNLSDLKKVEKIKDIYEKVRKKEMDKVEKELKHTVK